MGKVIVLPRDATPVDFAYTIHSDVGHSCVGAKVNGRIVPLRYTLKNGDVVEILTQAGHSPSKDWLNLVKTSRARNKIKHFINATAREKAIEIGQKYLEKEARRLGVSPGKATKAETDAVAAEYGLSKMEDLYAALGYGRYSARQVLQKMFPESVPEPEPAPETAAKTPAETPAQTGRGEAKDGDLVLKVKGADEIMVYRAKCCNPIKGEAIVGYVTRGKGVAVHSTNCTNVQNLMYEVERKIDVEWARSGANSFPVRMIVHTDDRPGMLNQLTTVLFNENSNIRSLEARGDDRRNGNHAIVEMTVEVKDKRQLEKVSGAIRRIPGVRDIERVQ
jgi:GTP pyrophosphokinase